MQDTSDYQKSFNAAMHYFVDSLTGRSTHTKQAYYSDLQQFKLFLVLFRPHTHLGISNEDVRTLKAELRRADGKLVDTETSGRRHRQSVRSLLYLERLDCDLSALRKEDVVAYFGYLESDEKAAPGTLSRRLAALRRFIRTLRRDGYPVSVELLDKMEDLRPRRARKLPLVLDQDEARAFLNVVDSSRDLAILYVMLFMGLRISEVVQLNVEQIGRDTQAISFLGKGNKERYVPVHPLVREAVLNYLEERPAVPADALGEPLFVSAHRRRIHPSTVRKLIKDYAAKAISIDGDKRRRLSPHKFRHTFATMLLEGQVDIRYIQELLGHEHLSTTQIYTAVRRKELHEAIDRHPLQLDRQINRQKRTSNHGHRASQHGTSTSSAQP